MVSFADRQKILSKYTGTVNNWMRRENGYYYGFVKPALPSSEILDTVKSQAVPRFRRGEPVECSLCGKLTMVASDVVMISETGLCGACELYKKGLSEFVEIERSPTIDEVISWYHITGDLSGHEIGVLVNAYLELTKESKK